MSQAEADSVGSGSGIPVRPGARCDLHMHSTRSDGRFAADDVLKQAAARGLDWIALTDHDLPTPFTPGPQQVGDRTISVLVGAEVSASIEGAEHHLLVYFPGQVPERFRAFCADQCRARATRWDDAVARLGMPELGPADEDARAGVRAVTRYHLAAAMVEAGRCGSVREAFQGWLGDGKGLVPCRFPTMEAVIAEARACGGVTSWAHPMRGAVEKHLARLVAAGLEGLEGYRPLLSSGDRQFYRKAARKHGLFLTGGSDWHGWSDGELGLWWVERRELDAFVAALEAAVTPS